MKIGIIGVDNRRIVDLSGGHNFRDLGGYATRDGRRLRWRQIYRSGSMAALDEQDQRRILELDIVTIVDLRSSRERQSQPSRLHPDACPFLWSREYDGSGGDLVAYLTSAEANPATARARMEGLYRELPYEQATGYRALFEQLADGAVPLLFHCAAGKDRTGVAAALLLDALGVPRETIAEDYGITNLFFDDACAQIRLSEGFLAELGAGILEPVMRAHPAYLTAMFDAIDTRHGSIEAYFRDALGLGPSVIASLRARLLD